MYERVYGNEEDVLLDAIFVLDEVGKSNTDYLSATSDFITFALILV